MEERNINDMSRSELIALKHDIQTQLGRIRKDCGVEDGSLFRFKSVAETGKYQNSVVKSAAIMRGIRLADKYTEIEARLRSFSKKRPKLTPDFFMDVCRERMSKQEWDAIVKAALAKLYEVNGYNDELDGDKHGR